MISTLTPDRPQRVPPSKDEREKIRNAVKMLKAGNTVSRPLTRISLEELARSVVPDESYLAWTMVLLGSEFWRQQVGTVPFSRRILLLPHCLRNAECCPAKYDADGLRCINCGQCELGGLKSGAEQLGYTVFIAEGSPVVMQLILRGQADAVLGAGCLRSLEKSFEKLQFAGIPALAVPLFRSDCKNSETDFDWVREMIQTPFTGTENRIEQKSPYLPLLREAARLFDRERKTGNTEFDITKTLADEFLTRGGKFYRPFITIATYSALVQVPETMLPVFVKTAAQAVEIFHKASLIHDDIEDDDPFRYGLPTLHRQYGIPAAVNTGDYLLGLGYQKIAVLRNEIPADIVAEMLAVLSEAHLRLSEGQGAELFLKEQRQTPPPADVMKIYVLKTAPAFQAAIELGILCAASFGGIGKDFYERMKEPLARFARHAGTAYQIKNDINDWFPDDENKQVAGNDAVQNRPTLLRALAKIPLDEDGVSAQEIYKRIRSSGAFDKARQLITKSADKAREIAEAAEPPAFRQLLLHFVEALAE
jgi:geranylgeranyl pyrophosphate synthase